MAGKKSWNLIPCDLRGPGSICGLQVHHREKPREGFKQRAWILVVIKVFFFSKNRTLGIPGDLKHYYNHAISGDQGGSSVREGGGTFGRVVAKDDFPTRRPLAVTLDWFVAPILLQLERLMTPLDSYVSKENHLGSGNRCSSVKSLISSLGDVSPGSQILKSTRSSTSRLGFFQTL